MHTRWKRIVDEFAKYSRFLCTQNKQYVQICIVGSGPAGFYTAHRLLQSNPNITVDMYEKLPVPYGLVRYGVAPDHPEIKNVITSFQKIAKKNNFNFTGNVAVGKDISVEELKNSYHAVVLSYGASEEKKLGIPNEEHIISAQEIVGWYNGTEKDSQLNLNLDIEEVAIIGHGNVALDISRIFLMPVDALKETDISEHALQALLKNRIKTVHVIGRRGPLQVAFTIKELREVLTLQGCQPILSKDDFEPFKEIIPKLPRPRKRITELMYSTALKSLEQKSEAMRRWYLKFQRTPLEIILNDTSKQITKLKLGINQMEEIDGVVVAKPTGKTEDLASGMVIRSVGYLGKPLDPSVPFDLKRGIAINKNGRVTNAPGIYCSGWIRTGPIGVIASTMNDSFDTAESILQDLKNGVLSENESKPGRTKVVSLLRSKGIQTVSFSDWEKIDRVEQERGKQMGKSRQKIVSSAEMLNIAKS